MSSDDNSDDVASMSTVSIEDISKDKDVMTADSKADTSNSENEEGKTVVSNSNDTEDNSVGDDFMVTVSNAEDTI